MDKRSWSVIALAILAVGTIFWVGNHLPNAAPGMANVPGYILSAIFFCFQEITLRRARSPGKVLPEEPRLRTKVPYLYVLAGLLCVVSGLVILAATNLASDSYMTTIQALEHEKHLVIDDYAWRVLGLTLNGLLVFYVWIPISGYIATIGARVLRRRPPYLFFVSVVFATFVTMALFNYGMSLFSGASLDATFGAGHGAMPLREKALRTSAALAMLSGVVVMQSGYMWVIGVFFAKRFRTPDDLTNSSD